VTRGVPRRARQVQDVLTGVRMVVVRAAAHFVVQLVAALVLTYVPPDGTAVNATAIMLLTGALLIGIAVGV
jgi:hypothetical protein